MKLIGRDAAQRRLRNALEDSEIGLVVVRGPSGAGKTALIDAVLGNITAQGTIIGRGKYAEDGLNGGFAPILQALSQAVSSALDMLYDPAAGTDSLRKILGSQLALLESAGFGPLDVLTSVERVAAPPLTGGEGAARIIDAIARLMRWLYGFGTPFVLFIDDWQRAPREAHPFVSMATREQSPRLCTVVFAERTPAPEIKRAHTDILEIGPLDPAERVALLSELVGDPAAAAAIAAWLGENASGLPLDLREAAQALIERSAISKGDKGWQLDTARAASIKRNDFTNTVIRRAQALPLNVLEIGIALALWGDRVSLRRAADALDRPIADIEEAAQRLQREGVLQLGDFEARFTHDRLRAALLAAVDPSARRALAAEMAERLLRSRPTQSTPRAALQFRLAAGLETAQPSQWRDRFADEALIARNTADSTTATAFAEAAWTLRERERGGDRAADALILREATLAAARQRDVAVVKSRIAEMIALAVTVGQLGESYEVGIVASSLAGEREMAWAYAREGLRKLGARLPAKARKIHLILAAARWYVSLALPSPPPPAGQTADTVDPLRRIVHFATVIAYAREPLMMLIMSLHAATRARRLGYRSAFYKTVDLVLHAAFDNPRRAAQIGAEVLEHPIPATFGRAATLYRALYMGVIWTMPLASLRDGFTRVYDIAITEGDLVYAGQAVRNAAQFAWRLEPTLEGVALAIREARERAEQLGDTIALDGMRAFAETISVLRDPQGLANLGETPPWSKLGVSAGAGAPIVWMEILGLLGDWAGVLTLAKRFEHARPGLNPHPGGAIWRFHENLARLRSGLGLRRGDLRYVRRAARLNPTDHQRKLLVLEAELLRHKGKAEACLKVYANAVDVAARGTSRLELGLAAECATAAARGFGRMELAAHYERVARNTWQAWGALARIGDAAAVSAEEPAPVRAQLAEAESKVAVAVRSERAKSRFLAEVGHELRTPLQGMQGLLDLAAEAPAEVSLNELRDVFGSLKRVVDDLTDLAALGGGAPLNLAVTDIAGLVASELHLASAMAKRKGLALDGDIPSQALLVKIDGARLRQVVRNLLSNAVKYTDSGKIALRLAAGPGTRDGTRRIAISVDDSGPGLRDSDLQRLFEPFERGEREDANGLGLGLALSRRIAERMGGTLTASLRPQGGSSFTLAFEAAMSSGAAEPATGVTPLRILLVEDVALNRRMIATILRRGGHRVTEAADGSEALALSAQHAFDLVLLDMGLPDIDGLNILDAIARSPRSGVVAIIVLTASTSDELAESARGQGAALVLHKPISAADLRAAIQATLPSDMRGEIAPLAAFDAEMDSLAQQAHAEILARGRALLEKRGTSDAAQDVHRLAGLAAQFGATEVATAADRLECDMRRNADESSGFARLAAALDALAPTRNAHASR